MHTQTAQSDYRHPFCAARASLLEQFDCTVVILTSRSLTETSTTDGVGRVDGGMDRQARCGDAPFRFEFILRCSKGILGLCQIAASLGQRLRSWFAPV